MEKIKKVENKEIAKIENQEVSIFNPEEDIKKAERAAKALMSLVSRKQKKVVIGGEQYVEYEDWMMVARFFNATVGIEWVHPLLESERIIGYEARAVVYQKGEIISAAEAMCTRGERNWSMRDEFMLKSMAQTRASAKALRNVFAYVVVLAGLKPTPAEETDGIQIEGEAKKELIAEVKADRKFQKELRITPIKKIIADKIRQIVGYEPKSKEEYEKIVLEKTQLELNEKNYGEIVNRLSVLVREMNPAYGGIQLKTPKWS